MMPLARNRTPSLDGGRRRTKLGIRTRVHQRTMTNPRTVRTMTNPRTVRTMTNPRTIRRTKTSIRNIRTRNMVTRRTKVIRRKTRSPKSIRTEMMGMDPLHHHLRPAATRMKARRSITDSGAVRRCYCQFTLVSMFRTAVLMHDIYCVPFPCCS
ncbi:hypothetical protein J4Q44_G00330540 [Coregonus suidteri]|uniref:Uncharacterized protein n=1 Tax=Coregonus suidteri TaxID=861788 RepID=A0AAN8KQJ6_9TELE